MPLFIDVHYKVEGLSDSAFRAAAHAQDLAVQDKHGVKFLKYWYDESTGRVFCMAEAPSKEAFVACHRDSHGVLADEIFEVKEGG